jgi:hypothetical protein
VEENASVGNACWTEDDGVGSNSDYELDEASVLYSLLFGWAVYELRRSPVTFSAANIFVALCTITPPLITQFMCFAWMFWWVVHPRRVPPL